MLKKLRMKWARFAVRSWMFALPLAALGVVATAYKARTIYLQWGQGAGQNR